MVVSNVSETTSKTTQVKKEKRRPLILRRTIPAAMKRKREPVVEVDAVESLEQMQTSLYKQTIKSAPLTTFFDRLNRVNPAALFECLTDSLNGLAMIHNVDDLIIDQPIHHEDVRHNVILRYKEHLPYDLTTDDICISVDILDDLIYDMVNGNIAKAAKRSIEDKLREFYAGRSIKTSKFVLRVQIFQVSDGSIGGTFLSGKSHLLNRTILGLKWALFETNPPKERTIRWNIFDPFGSNRRNEKSPTTIPNALVGGMDILTKPLKTDFLDFFGKGKECVTEQLAPIGALKIVKQIGFHSVDSNKPTMKKQNKTQIQWICEKP